MEDFTVIVLRLINGLFTVSFLPIIYGTFIKTRKRFYLLWGIGFFLYGVHIVLRTVFTLLMNETPLSLLIISYLVQLIGFSLILTGIGDLVNRTRPMLLSSLSVPAVILILYFTTQPIILGNIITLLPYLFISLSLIVVWWLTKVSIEYFIIGWNVLLLANLGSVVNYLPPIFVEILVIFGKIVLLNGIRNRTFTLLVDDLARFLISGRATEYAEFNNGQIQFIDLSSATKKDEYQWLKNSLTESTSKDVRTILVSTYDVISEKDLKRNGLEGDDLYFIRMLQGRRPFSQVFKEHVMTINDDLADLDLLIMDVIQFANEHKINCQIIIHTLSSLIHTHGWKRVYTFLVSKIQHIKRGPVSVYILYYPDTHTNKSDIAKFEKMADIVTKV